MRDHRSLRILLLSSMCLAGLAGGTVGATRMAAGEQGPPAPREARPQQGQPPRDPNAPGAPVVAGKGSISGTVVVAGSGQPARKARVSLSGGAEAGRGGAGGRSTTTDDAGRFVFSALPEGRFNLSASKPGHVSGTYGQRQAGRPGTPIQLADGQNLQVQLQITRGGVITGTALDENAEAVPGTPVRALRYVMQSGQRTLQQSGTGQTDDRGVYRIYGLQPGEYIVFATPRNNNQGLEAGRQAELQQLLQQSEVAGLQPRIEEIRAAMQVTMADDTVTGYAPVYYPGTTTPASAATVTVGPGEEKGSVDFQYQVVPIARVEGIVTSTSAQLPPNVQLTLVSTTFTVPGISPGSARADAQGGFRISNVPPGQYTLVARATIGGAGRGGGAGGRAAGRGQIPGGRGEILAGRGRGEVPSGVDPIRLWATTDVTVDGRNVSNVVLTLQPGMSVSGRVVFDGATVQPPADLTRVRISLAPVSLAPVGTPGEVATAAAGRVDAEGRFTIAGVVPGGYRLTASGAGTGWYLGSSSVNGQESLDFPIEVKANQGINGAVVSFVDRQSELTGTIVNERAQPVPDYTLIVYPADPRFWTPQSRRIRSARPATDGRYSFRGLPAGEYRLVPVYDPEPGSWFDPAFLQQLETASVRVSIAEGEKKDQSLRVPGGG